MTADIHFNRWMRRASIVFLFILFYVLMADMTIPMTPHSMVQRPVITIAPQVAGQVIEVAVTNNQSVKSGDLLFRIDPQNYQLELEKAQLNLQEAAQTNDNLRAQLAYAEAAIKEAEAESDEKQREIDRLRSLHTRNLVSQQQVDIAASQAKATAAKLQATRESRQAMLVQLGEDGEQNLRLRIARNQLQQAQLNLSRTEVRAPADGVISNLQLTAGIQAQARQSLMSLVVSDSERISADFREKSLRQVKENAPGWIVFDAIPGRVFSAVLDSRDQGVAEGQQAANGQLAQPDDSDRWVRDAQRVRVYLTLNDHQLPNALVTGSRATVMLAGSDNALLRWIGAVEMHVISLLHYVY